jgi:hypothetical protein
MLKAALPILAFVASLASAWFWWSSATKPLALLDTIEAEMQEAARRNRRAALAAFSAAVFQGLAALQSLL